MFENNSVLYFEELKGLSFLFIQSTPCVIRDITRSTDGTHLWFSCDDLLCSAVDKVDCAFLKQGCTTYAEYLSLCRTSVLSLSFDINSKRNLLCTSSNSLECFDIKGVHMDPVALKSGLTVKVLLQPFLHKRGLCWNVRQIQCMYNINQEDDELDFKECLLDDELKLTSVGIF